MAWYRSIGIDLSEIVTPQFVKEYENSSTGDTGGSTQTFTFTVTTAGLYFLGTYGSQGTTRINIVSVHSPYYKYDASVPGEYMHCAFVDLDVGDTVNFTNTTSSSNGSATFQAVRITNAEFLMLKTLYPVSPTDNGKVQYTPLNDGNMYFIFAGASNGSNNPSYIYDRSVIPSTCSFAKTAAVKGNIDTCFCYSVGCIGPEVYVDIYGSYAGRSAMMAAILTPVSQNP